MNPADIVKADRLADAVCHREQMDIWTDEVLFILAERIAEPVDYEDSLAMRREIGQAIRHVIDGAFSHPEILGIPIKQ